MIATFLAVLELMKTGELVAEQDENMDDIRLSAGSQEVTTVGVNENESYN